ncbi:MAG TPA: methyltransferase domain-containing protein, partial [Kofleriaceae bacterium]|nr:methyltransferase domain-containing protein [Kofleriaceae bacterium]
ISGVLHMVGDALTASGLAVYDERARTGQLRYVVVRASRDGDPLVGIVTTSDAPRPALEAVTPLMGARGVVWLPNDATSGAILGREAHLLCGDATIPERIDGLEIEVGIDTFLQVNLDAAEALYRRLVERVAPRPGMSALDVYCGIGPIALLLARAGADVLGVERNPASVDAARAAAARNGIAARFEETPAAELPALLAARPVDVVVVNPPRQGLEESVRGALAAQPPATLVYVSCGPDSLGRDLAGLGLRVESVEPFDLMPGTGHVETLVIAKRR